MLYQKLSLFFLCFIFVLAVNAEVHNVERVNPRRHHEIAHRAPGNIQLYKREFTSARFTFYTLTGVGTCGKNIDQSAYTVALSYLTFDDSVYPSPDCWKQVIIEYGGKTTTAVIADMCPGDCPAGALDFTTALFEHVVGDLGIGQTYGTWYYADDPPNTPTPTPKSTYVPPPPPPTSTYVPPPPPPPPPTTSTTTSTRRTTSSTSTWKSTTTSKTTSTLTPTPTPTSTSTSKISTSTSTVYTTSVNLAAGPAGNVASVAGISPNVNSNINVLNQIVVNLGGLVVAAAHSQNEPS